MEPLLEVAALPGIDPVQMQNSVEMYKVFQDIIITPEKIYQERRPLRYKAYVQWIVERYCGSQTGLSIGSYIKKACKHYKGIFITYFVFDAEFTKYCCGESMKKCIEDYHEEAGNVTDNNPWRRYKRLLCETIMDSFVVFYTDSNGVSYPRVRAKEPKDTKTVENILIDNCFYERLNSAVGERDRFSNYFTYVSPGYGKSCSPWEYECKFFESHNIHETAKSAETRKIMDEGTM
jgi:hypothetical protein